MPEYWYANSRYRSSLSPGSQSLLNHTLCPAAQGHKSTFPSLHCSLSHYPSARLSVSSSRSLRRDINTPNLNVIPEEGRDLRRALCQRWGFIRNTWRLLSSRKEEVTLNVPAMKNQWLVLYLFLVVLDGQFEFGEVVTLSWVQLFALVVVSVV